MEVHLSAYALGPAQRPMKDGSASFSLCLGAGAEAHEKCKCIFQLKRAARASGVIVWGCRPPGATGLQWHAYFVFSGCASMRPTTCEACVFSCSLCRGCSSRGESDLYPNAAGLALLRCRCEPNVVSSSLALVTRFSFALPGAGMYGIQFNWRMLIKG